MTTPAGYGSCQPTPLLELQMAPFTLAMKGILQVRGPGLSPESVAGPAWLHRLALVPNIAPVPIVVVALGAGHPASFMDLVTELHRGLTVAARDSHFEQTHGRGLGA
jgi:hypothetical protein